MKEKKIALTIILMLITSILFAQSMAVSTFVESYFIDEEYRIITSTFGDKEVYFALNYAETEATIPPKSPTASRGIVFYFQDNTFTPLLYVNNNCIHFGSGELFFNGDYLPTFLAWEIHITPNKSIALTRHGVKGNITDPIRFIWNNEKSTFEKYVIDRSQW